MGIRALSLKIDITVAGQRRTSIWLWVTGLSPRSLMSITTLYSVVYLHNLTRVSDFVKRGKHLKETDLLSEILSFAPDVTGPEANAGVMGRRARIVG